MKTTQVLLKQHIGWYFKKHWVVQGRRIPQNTGAENALVGKGIPILKAENIANRESLLEESININQNYSKLDPNWHDRVCYTYKDNNVLLEGLNQAKIITKTVELKDGLSDFIKIKNVDQHIHKKVRNIILNSCLFDAEQKKLPKVKDPERPAWNFPRSYGVTQERYNKSLILKFLQLTELISKPEVVKQRTILNNLEFSFPFEKFGDLFQLQLRSDTMLLSSKALPPITETSASLSFDLPDLFPIKHTITLNEDNTYELKNTYPVNLNLQKSHPHTIFVHYNNNEVKNKFEEEVTESQVVGRSLMKTFTVAAAYAKEKYGNDVKELPVPITLQCVHTDGRLFHFGILQLNTLDLEDQGKVKNIWYHEPRIALYTSCGYKSGVPELEDYNGNVINHIVAMYNNI